MTETNRSVRSRDPGKRKKHRVWKILLLILAAVVLACAVSIWVSYHWLTVTDYTVRSGKITNPFHIVLISDLHDHVFAGDNDRLVRKIAEEEPDLIVMDGDMINRDSDSDAVAVDLVKKLVKVADVYYAMGNHEIGYEEDGHTGLEADLEDAGAVVLNHTNADITVKGNKIRMGGMYEYAFETGMQSEEANRTAMQYLHEYVDTDRYMIMCAHVPGAFASWNVADDWGIDLVLSGHLHGGQVIIPFVGGLYSQLEGFFPGVDYGKYELGDSEMIVTRGLGSNHKILPRFNNPPEIVNLTVEPEK